MVPHGLATGMDEVRCAGTRGGALLALLVVSGCMMVGPEYRRPPAPLANAWIARDTNGIGPESEPIGPWWETFRDPVLTNLVVEGYRQNPSLQAAGARVLGAQARRGIAIGGLDLGEERADREASPCLGSQHPSASRLQRGVLPVALDDQVRQDGIPERFPPRADRLRLGPDAVRVPRDPGVRERRRRTAIFGTDHHAPRHDEKR